MTTLVIHPKDPSTDFLSSIYTHKLDWKVLRSKLNQSKLRRLIKIYDRIICLGHGSEYGLIGFNELIIDHSIVSLLKEKQIVLIWCNADIFVKKHELKPILYTGMIISELEEAVNESVYCNGQQIEESNWLFAFTIGQFIDYADPLIYIQSIYNQNKDSTKVNNIIEFNKTKIYSRL